MTFGAENGHLGGKNAVENGGNGRKTGIFGEKPEEKHEGGKAKAHGGSQSATERPGAAHGGRAEERGEGARRRGSLLWRLCKTGKGEVEKCNLFYCNGDNKWNLCNFAGRKSARRL